MKGPVFLEALSFPVHEFEVLLCFKGQENTPGISKRLGTLRIAEPMSLRFSKHDPASLIDLWSFLVSEPLEEGSDVGEGIKTEQLKATEGRQAMKVRSLQTEKGHDGNQ